MLGPAREALRAFETARAAVVNVEDLRTGILELVSVPAYAADPMAALAGADALIVATEWKEFRSPDFEAIRSALREPLVFDGRNLYEPALVRAAGLEYFAIGRR